MSIRYPNANYPTAYDEANMSKADGVSVNTMKREIQSAGHDGTGGDFTLSFDGQGPTGAIAFDDTAADVKTALELLSNITTVEVTGAGSIADPFLVTFVDPGPASVPLMTGDDTGLTGETLGLVIALVQDGDSALVVTEATGAPL